MVKDNTFAKEFVGEANKRGSEKLMMSDVVGMPDAEDAALLERLVSMYEEKTGGLLGYTLRQARRGFEAGRYGSTYNDKAKVSKQTGMTYDFELPESFVNIVEKHWPTMFRDKKHYAWFKRKLPQLMIRPKF